MLLKKGAANSKSPYLVIRRLSKNDGDPARRGMLGDLDPFSAEACLERSVCVESDDELL